MYACWASKHTLWSSSLPRRQETTWLRPFLKGKFCFSEICQTMMLCLISDTHPFPDPSSSRTASSWQEQVLQDRMRVWQACLAVAFVASQGLPSRSSSHFPQPAFCLKGTWEGIEVASLVTIWKSPQCLHLRQGKRQVVVLKLCPSDQMTFFTSLDGN